MSLRKLAGARVKVWQGLPAWGPARSFGHPPWPKWPDCFEEAPPGFFTILVFCPGMKNT